MDYFKTIIHHGKFNSLIHPFVLQTLKVISIYIIIKLIIGYMSIKYYLIYTIQYTYIYVYIYILILYNTVIFYSNYDNINIPTKLENNYYIVKKVRLNYL